MIIDDLQLTGALQISLNNEIVHQCDNLVVTAGKNWVAGRFKDGSIPDEMSHMALGDTDTAAAAGNTTPATEFIDNAGVEVLVSAVLQVSADQYILQDKSVSDNEIFELNGIVLGTYQSLYVKSTGALTFTFIGFEEVAEIPS